MYTYMVLIFVIPVGQSGYNLNVVKICKDTRELFWKKNVLLFMKLLIYFGKYILVSWHNVLFYVYIKVLLTNHWEIIWISVGLIVIPIYMIIIQNTDISNHCFTVPIVTAALVSEFMI